MILKSLLEQEITKDVIEYTIFSASYLVNPDSNVASAILNKLYNLFNNITKTNLESCF